MSDDEIDAVARRLLAGLDFAQVASASEEAHRREIDALLRVTLDIVDALEALEQRAREQALHAPIARAVANAHRALAGAGLERLDLVGKPLDLATSEVVELRPGEAAMADVTVAEIVSGYLYRNRLLRRARVVVAHDGGTADDTSDGRESSR